MGGFAKFLKQMLGSVDTTSISTLTNEKSATTSKDCLNSDEESSDFKFYKTDIPNGYYFRCDTPMYDDTIIKCTYTKESFNDMHKPDCLCIPCVGDTNAYIEVIRMDKELFENIMNRKDSTVMKTDIDKFYDISIMERYILNGLIFKNDTITAVKRVVNFADGYYIKGIMKRQYNYTTLIKIQTDCEGFDMEDDYVVKYNHLCYYIDTRSEGYARFNGQIVTDSYGFEDNKEQYAKIKLPSIIETVWRGTMLNL